MSKVIRMKKTYKKVKLKNSNSPNRFYNLNSEKYKVILLLFSIVSILLGSLLYGNLQSSILVDVISDKIYLLKSGTYLQIFLFLLKTEIIFFLIAMFVGTSFLGAPLTAIPILLRGLITGYIGSYMYNEFELKGVLFCLLFVFPYTAIATTSLIFASNESVYMSNKSFNTITNKNTADNISIQLYLLRYLILIVVNSLCALLNSLLVVLFINKINL